MNAGICLNREGQGVVIVPTRRADLHWDRFKHQIEHNQSIENLVDRNGEFRPVTPPNLLALFDLDSEKAAAKVSATLIKFWEMHGRILRNSAATISVADATFTIDYLMPCWGLKPRAPAPAREKPPEWKSRDVVNFDDVPDPSMSPAEYWHRLAKGEDVEEFATILAPINLTTLIGGLARIPNRHEMHEKGAREYRSLYDRAILMGNPRAIDYSSAVQVDNSRNTFYARTDDASGQFHAASKAVGMGAKVVDPIILHDDSVSAVARRVYGSAGGQARKRVNDELAIGLDRLAVHFGLTGSAASRSRTTAWLSERLPLDLPPVA